MSNDHRRYVVYIIAFITISGGDTPQHEPKRARRWTYATKSCERREKRKHKRSWNRKVRKLISATKEWTRQDDEYRETSTTLPFSSLSRLSSLCIFSMEPGARLGRWGRRFQGESEKVRKEQRLLPWTRAIWMNRNATCSEMRWKELSQGKDRSEKVWTTACGGGWLHEKRYNEKPNRTDGARAKIDLQTKMYFQIPPRKSPGKLHARRKQQMFRIRDRNIFPRIWDGRENISELRLTEVFRIRYSRQIFFQFETKTFITSHNMTLFVLSQDS